VKDRFTTIEFPVLSYYVVHVEITVDIRAAMKKYKNIKDLADEDFPGDNPACAVHVKGENFSFMFFRPNPSINAIAHESWHVVRRIMDHLGADLDNEMVAYHLGYLVEKVFKFVRRKR
jgi:hypothetical protein